MPIETGSDANRVHVKCEKPVDKRFTYFYVSTSDPRLAARALSLMEAAQLGDKLLNIEFDANNRLQLGCPLGEVCRAAVTVALVESPLSTDRCAFDNNRPGCPGYCATTDDILCPRFCQRHPTEEVCSAICNRDPSGNQCQQYCAAHPTERICVRSDDPCDMHPQVKSCRDRN
jgi:hypothetical protein